MRIELRDMIEVETVFDKSRPESNKLSAMQIMIYAVSGHGKTLAEEREAQKLHDEGTCVIPVTEKSMHRLEIGFAGFLPRQKYHLNYLKEQGVTPAKKKIRIHGVFSFNEDNYWTKQIFPVEFFTFPIKLISPKIWALIFETTTRSQSVTAIVSAQNDLRDDEGLQDLIRIASDKIRNNVVAGSEKTITDIETFLEPFKKAYFLTPMNCKYNFKPEDLFFDQESYHIMHYGFLPKGSDKQEYVAVNLVVNSIVEKYELLKKHPVLSKKLPPLLLIVQEALAFLPQATNETYIQISAELFEKILIQGRSLGISTLSDSQKWIGISETYRNAMTDEYYGQLSTADVERLSKIRRYPSEVRKRLEGMPKNHYFKKGDNKERVPLFPCHSHCEEGEDFYVAFAETYPDLLKNHREEYEYMSSLMKAEKERQAAYEKEKARKEKEEKLKKELKNLEKNTEFKEEKAKLISEVKDKDSELKKQLYINVFRDSKLNGSKVSWVVLGKKYGVSDKTCKDYAELGKKLVEQAPI